MASGKSGVDISVESPDQSRPQSAHSHHNNMDTRIPPTEDDITSLDQAIKEKAAESAKKGGKGGRGRKSKPGPIKPKNGISVSAPASPHLPLVRSNLSLTQNSEEDEVDTYWPLPELDENEYVIPIPIGPRLKCHYLYIMDDITPEITRIFSEDKPDEETIAAVRRNIIELDGMVIHPDIADRTAHEQEASEGDLTWAEAQSHKVNLIIKTLQAMRNPDKPIHVAIVARHGKVMEVIRRPLDLEKFAFKTITNEETKSYNGESNLKIDLIASDHTGEGLAPVDLIFVVDSSCNRNSPVAVALRGEKKAPILFSWVFGSPEHIGACLPPTYDDIDFLRTYCAALVQTRVLLGQMPKFGPDKPMWNHIGDWALAGFKDKLAVEPMRRLEFIGLEIMFKPHDESNKRSRAEFEASGTTSPSKRLKMSEDLDLFVDVPTNEADCKAEIAALRKQVDALRTRARSQDAQILTLHTKLSGTEQKLAESEKENHKNAETAHELMQFCDHFITRSEERKSLAATVIRKNQAFEATIHEKDGQLRDCATRIEELEETERELRQQLKIKKGIGKGIPYGTTTNGAPEGMEPPIQVDNEDLVKKLAANQKRIESLERDRDYAFQMYRDASDSAVGHVNENATLQEEVNRLTLLATNVTGRTNDEIDHAELGALREAYERILVEKEELTEQVKASSNNNRMATRGAPLGSRSPMRYAGESSPPRSRASSRQPVSRTGSPTPKSGIRRGFSGRLQES